MDVLTVLVCLSVCLCVKCQDIAVVFDGDREELDQVASGLGLQIVREFKYSEISLLQQSEEFSSRHKRSSDHLETLRSHPKIISAHEDEIVYREKRYIVYDKQLEMPLREITDNSIYQRVSEARLSTRTDLGGNHVQFSDPLYSDQWSLFNYGQTYGRPGIDLNVRAAWEAGYTGKGIVVVITDDGIYHNHTDLVQNYDPTASTDLNDPDDKEEDPMPDMSTEDKLNENSLTAQTSRRMSDSQRHGTWCAGEIAASAHNDACGVGIAFECKIGGIRLLDGNVTDAMEAEALLFNNQHIHIYSSSWGPYDDGRSMDGPRPHCAAALRKGVRLGRGGKGSIFVWATGNGGANGDNCGADGYVSSIETMSFGSVTDKGTMPYFMERCTSTLAVVPSGGEEVQGEEQAANITKIKVVTTDLNDGCIENFQGTSSAAPYAAGCSALALQANPDLTWRDVQHLVVHSSRIPSVDHSWIINGAGLHVSHNFGFGMLDCGRMVALAETWVNVPEQHTCKNQRMAVNKNIPSRGYIRDEVIVGCHGAANRIHRVEHAQVHVELEHSRRGDLEIYLVSPSNTWSRVLAARPLDDNKQGIDFDFMTVHSWGEHPEGHWALYIKDMPSRRKRVNTGQLKSWTLTLYGTVDDQVMRVKAKGTGEAHFPNLVEVEQRMKKEEKRANDLKVTPLDQMHENSAGMPSPVSPGTHPKPGNGPMNRQTARLLQDLISNYDKASDSMSHALEAGADGEVLLQQKKYIDSNKHSKQNMQEEKAINELADILFSEIKSEEEAERREEKRKAEEKRKEERRKVMEKKMLEDHLLDDLVRRLGDEFEETKRGHSGNHEERGEKEEDRDLLQRFLQEFTQDLQERGSFGAAPIEEDERSRGSKQTGEVTQLGEVVRLAPQDTGHNNEKKRGEEEKKKKGEDLTVRTLSELLKYLQEQS